MEREVVTSYFNTERQREDLALGLLGGWRIQTKDGRYAFVANFRNEDEAEGFIGEISDEGVSNAFDLVRKNSTVLIDQSARGLRVRSLPIGVSVWQRRNSTYGKIE